MVADMSQIADLGALLTDAARRLLASPFVPGAVTLVLELGPQRPDWLAGRDEIALRIPDDARLRDVLRRTGRCLSPPPIARGLKPRTPVTRQARS